MKFEWDANKAASNKRKHGISFETATRVFADPARLEIQDRWQGGEERWQTIGMVDGQVLLLVAHTIRDEAGTEVIRIISARRAEKSERRIYEDA